MRPRRVRVWHKDASLKLHPSGHLQSLTHQLSPQPSRPQPGVSIVDSISTWTVMQASVCVYNTSMQDYERLQPNRLITHRKRGVPIEPQGGLSDADGDLAKIAELD